MCNLKIQGMDRAGETGESIVRIGPDGINFPGMSINPAGTLTFTFKTAAERDAAYLQLTGKADPDFRTDVEKEWAKEKVMDDKDQGAAVRGEAVAEYLPPLPETTYNGYSDGSEPLFTCPMVWKYAREYAKANRVTAVEASEPTERDTAIMHVCQEAARKLTTYAQIYTGDKQAVRLAAELTNIARAFSARAADAPSEPSDAEIIEIARQAIRAGSAMWDHFEKDDAGKFTVPVLNPKDFMLVRAVLAAVKSRAADALDSQPTSSTITPNQIAIIQDMLIWPVTEDDAKAARDLLQELHFDLSMQEQADSQPTDFEDRPLKARVLRNELAIIIGCQDGRTGAEKADAVLSWIEKQGQHVFVPASSQPTDGGVRNG